METQLSLPSKKPQVFVDYREREIGELLEKLGAKVNFVNLPIGDFSTIKSGIERKSFRDFISSITDGRLFEQTKNLKESYENAVIIIEGEIDFWNINENSYYAAISYLINNKVNVIFSRSKVETSKIVYWIAKKEEENKNFSGFKIKKKKKDFREIQELIVSSFPGISTTLSKRILKKFGSIKNFILASERELKKVEGIGDVLARRIKEIIDKKYGD